MEHLLALSFTSLSSRHPLKIRKGLRQIEGLLAQICLSSSPPRHSTPSKRQSLALPFPNTNPPAPSQRSLQDLHTDPAFLEFLRLQDSFTSNIATRILELLNSILSTKSHPASTTTPIITLALSILLGLLLLHPPSRLLFQRQGHMNILLDLLDPRGSPPEVLSQTLLVLVAALVGMPGNARVFEGAEGLATVVSVFKAQGRDVTVNQEVRFRVLEFLYFYLMPEGPSVGSAMEKQQQQKEPQSQSRSSTQSLVGDQQQSQSSSPVKVSETIKSDGSGSGSGNSSSNSTSGGDQGQIRSIGSKQALLGRHLGNVGELVEDLRRNAPFGLTAF
ncbi:MAG: hypothetical protein M1828_004054 [Chrysothrix sp. TS-e1954]|nr:MAG: hypothetical protein M1828_004054 [Chrysothrix sp. TS-e1954]